MKSAAAAIAWLWSLLVLGTLFRFSIFLCIFLFVAFVPHVPSSPLDLREDVARRILFTSNATHHNRDGKEIHVLGGMNVFFLETFFPRTL